MFNVDAQAALGFLTSQTAHIEAEVYEIQYPDIQYPELVPIDTSANEWASRWPGLVRYGKWIGIGFGCYHVEEAVRSGNTVTATVSPPLQRDVAAGEFVSLRPSLICQAGEVSSFVGMYEAGDLVKPGSLTMMQVRDERFL